MKPNMFIMFLMFTLLQHVNGKPSALAKKEQLAHRKGFELDELVAKIKDCLYKLYQVERYYQQLFIRGYLSDNNTEQLEQLQRFIGQLKDNLNTLLKRRAYF